MNKQYQAFALLLVFLVSNSECSTFQKAQDQAITYAFNTAVLSGIIYLGGKVIAQHEVKTLPDASPHVQQWARKIFAEKGLKDAALVPLKVGDQWAVGGGSFIQIGFKDEQGLNTVLSGKSKLSEAEQKNLLAEKEYEILHELNHYQNGDFGKICLVTGAVSSLVFPVIRGKNVAFGMPSLSTETLKSVGAAGVSLYFTPYISIPYRRYQETEADHYAFMDISSFKNIKIVKANLQSKADICEKVFLDDSMNTQLNDHRGFCGKQLNPAILKSLQGIEKDMAETDNDADKLLELRGKKRRLIELSHLLLDPDHPSFQTRAELAQECYDKRKAQHKERFKRTLNVLLSK